MNPIQSGNASRLMARLTLAALVLTAPAALLAKGGSGGGGGAVDVPRVVESRVTGYVTAINHSAGTLTVGASYYGSGQLKVTSATKFSFLTGSGGFANVKLGDWVEARYLFSTKEATKISVTPSSP